jgi:hypothetical protein
MRWAQPALRAVRVSPQAYHSDAQHEYLAAALRACR